MVLRHNGSVRKGCIFAIGLTAATLVSSQQAEARGHRVHHAAAHHASHRSLVDSPKFSALVVDANTGRTLYAVSENELRHPASITKVMTLYLLFEKLAKGDLSLDTPIPVSRHAASMSPTKLGVPAGRSVTVETAIKAIVTRSANDMAVTVAEAVGGDEQSFASIMTRKAHALGMSRTVYVNASGLPDDRQLTSAHDLVILGRAIRDDFPQYYHYFSIPGFNYAGHYIGTHNHLMERTQGMDGIKTGYTRASGFNLLSSVVRNGHHLISVVMGGKSAASRDNVMASLIENHLEEAAPTRTAAVIAPSPVEEPAPPVRVARAEIADDDDRDEAPSRARGPNLIAPTLAVPPTPTPAARPSDRARTVSPSDRARTVSQDDSDDAKSSASERPRPAFIAGAPKLDPARLPQPMAPGDRRRLVLDGSTSARPAQPDSTAVPLATSTPSTLRWIAGPSGTKSTVAARPVAYSKDDVTGNIEPAAKSKAEESRAARNDAKDRPNTAAAETSSRGGWVIQIGATDAADKATDLLNRAKTEGRSALATARPFTEKVKRGDSTLYRARFAGLDTNEAEAACKALKRSGFACIAMKD